MSDKKTETRSGATPIGPSLAAARVQTLGVRPSIRGLMIAVAVLAGLFSVRSLWSVIVLAFVCPGFALIGARWLLSRDYRRPTAIWFGIAATTVNAALRCFLHLPN